MGTLALRTETVVCTCSVPSEMRRTVTETERFRQAHSGIFAIHRRHRSTLFRNGSKGFAMTDRQCKKLLQPKLPIGKDWGNVEDRRHDSGWDGASVRRSGT